MEGTVKPLIAWCNSTSKTLKSEKALTSPCSFPPIGKVHRSRVSWISIDMEVISLLRESQTKDFCSFMNLGDVGREKDEGRPKEKYWVLNQSGENCLQVSQSGDFQIEAPGLRMLICVRAWPAGGS